MQIIDCVCHTVRQINQSLFLVCILTKTIQSIAWGSEKASKKEECNNFLENAKK
jgi:hypothetical protein